MADHLDAQLSKLPNRGKFLTQLLIDVVCFFSTVTVGILVASLALRFAGWLFGDWFMFEAFFKQPFPQPQLWESDSIVAAMLVTALASVAVLYVIGVMSIGVRIASAMRSAFGVEWFWDELPDGEQVK